MDTGRSAGRRRETRPSTTWLSSALSEGPMYLPAAYLRGVAAQLQPGLGRNQAAVH